MIKFTSLLAALALAGSYSAIAHAQVSAKDGVLVGPNGHTLYTFDNDKTEGKSACNGPCATTWPATGSGSWTGAGRSGWRQRCSPRRSLFAELHGPMRVACTNCTTSISTN